MGTIFPGGRLDPGLGSDYEIFKGSDGTEWGGRGVARAEDKCPSQYCVMVDLVAVNRLIQEAKANVVEFLMMKR